MQSMKNGFVWRKAGKIAVTVLTLSFFTMGCGSETEADVTVSQETTEPAQAEMDDAEENNGIIQEDGAETADEENEDQLKTVPDSYEYTIIDPDEQNGMVKVLGLQLPDGWESGSGFMIGDDYLSLYLCKKGENEVVTDQMIIMSEDEYNDERKLGEDTLLGPWVDENAKFDEIIFTKDKKADIMTEFGPAEIYWYEWGELTEYCDYEYEQTVEQNGTSYYLHSGEVAKIVNGKYTILCFYHVSGREYPGCFEELLPQMMTIEE